MVTNKKKNQVFFKAICLAYQIATPAAVNWHITYNNNILMLGRNTLHLIIYLKSGQHWINSNISRELL